MLDEAAAVPCLATALAEPDLERRERTYETDELDRRAVERNRDVHPSESRPAERQQAAEHDEEHEGQMRDEDEISGSAEDHRRIRHSRRIAQTEFSLMISVWHSLFFCEASTLADTEPFARASSQRS